MKHRTGRNPHDPTPDEIREACAQIRATWSEAERMKRRRGPMNKVWAGADAAPWTPPVVPEDTLPLAPTWEVP